MTDVLTFATYNVHGFRGHFGEADLRRTAAVIDELDADVVAVQEVTGLGEDLGPRALRVLDDLEGYHCFVAPTRSKRGGFGNAVLTRHEVLRAERVDLSHRRREPRAALDLDVDIGGVEARVVAAHLGLKHFERRQQVERLLEHLGDAPSPFLVVLGDFNDWIPGAPAVRLLEARFGASPRVPSFPAWRPLFSLDRIWVHPGSALVEVTAHRSRLARRASDHLPIVARVTHPEATVEHVGPPRDDPPARVIGSS